MCLPLNARISRINRIPLLVFAIGFSALVLGPVLGDDLYVPSQHATIQDAITAASVGDTVFVDPGVYAETINFLGKAITVISTDGPEFTTIDAELLDTVVRFENAEGPDSVLQGFTITNGLVFGGLMAVNDAGGILCVDASPTLRGNVITSNSTNWNGAGITLKNSAAVVVDNEIRLNGFFCLIVDVPCGRGGGVFVSGGAPLIQNNKITDNSAPAAGGGLYLTDGTTADVIGNQILSNFSARGGGIVVGEDAEPFLMNNLIAGNGATGFVSLGGAIPGYAGGIYIEDSANVTIESCTIAANTATGFSVSGQGGGLVVENDSVTTISHSVIYGNSADLNSQIEDATAGTLTIEYCDVQGGWLGDGNIDDDPLFTTGVGYDYALSQLAAGQIVDSPCVNAGDPGAGLIGGSTRSDGAPDTGALDLGFHWNVADSTFIRGDCNGDGSVNIADAVFVLGSLFPGTGTAPQATCRDGCDGNDDGEINISDPVVILGAIFGIPPTPLPAPSSCGTDATADALECVVQPSCP